MKITGIRIILQLEQINWYLVAEDSTAATMFDNGELDETSDFSAIISRNIKAEAEAGKSL